MAIKNVERQKAAADREVTELRQEIEQLHEAMEQANQTVFELGLERDAAVDAEAKTSVKLKRVFLLLDECRATARELAVDLARAENEASTLRRELQQAQATAEIRGRLIDDIIGARAWNRGKAIRRAARVQVLLPRG